MHGFRYGQSLIEVLIGAALGALLVAGGAALIAPSLQTNKTVSRVQTEAQLGEELTDNVAAWVAGGWNNVLAVATGAAHTYYLNASSSPFTVGSTSQSIVIASITYNRYFYVSDVYRDSNGNVTSTAPGNNYDPSIKQITVVVNTASSASNPLVYAMYLTRNAANTFNQTSWAGGSGQNNPVVLVGTSYAMATSVEVSATGSLMLSSPVGGSCED